MQAWTKSTTTSLQSTDGLNMPEDKNSQEHQEIRDLVHDVKLGLSVEIEKVAGAVRSHRLIALVVWAILALAISVTSAMVSRGIDFLEKLNEEQHETSLTIKSWVPFATEWGDNLEEKDAEIQKRHEHDVDELRQDVKQLRRNQQR